MKNYKKQEIKQNLKLKYHQLLTQVGKVIDVTIKKHLNSIAYNNFPEKKLMYKKMLTYKEGTQKLRGMAAYLALRVFSKNISLTQDNVKRILAAVELENYSNYALNWGFDGKAGSIDKKSRNESILAAFGFLNEALDIIEDMPLISYHIRKYNHRVHRGWTPEIYDLRFDNPKIFSDFDLFWKAYEIRNIEAGGQFYGSYVTLANIFGKNDDMFCEKLKEIYITFGEYVQIINDLGDFALIKKKWVSEKKVVDQFSDLRNEVITWPTWLMYTKGSNEDKAFLESIPGKKSLTNEEAIRVSKLFFNYAYEDIIKKLRKKRRYLQKQIKKLDIDAEVKGLMQVMFSMVSSNKILKELEIQKTDFQKEFVVLVNERDKVIGTKEKIQAHIDGDLHRAFSILIFNKKHRLLLQQRVDTKYHCPELWSNTVCSHPKEGELLKKAAHRRLVEEMGFDCPLKRGFKFQYRAEFSNGLIENEIDRIFFGEYDGKIKPNPREVKEYKWISLNKLRSEIKKVPDKYTPWLKIILEKLNQEKSLNLGTINKF